MILSISFDAMSWRHWVECGLMKSWFIDMSLLRSFHEEDVETKNVNTTCYISFLV
jgi:hypothetical protein